MTVKISSESIDLWSSQWTSREIDLVAVKKSQIAIALDWNYILRREIISCARRANKFSLWLRVSLWKQGSVEETPHARCAMMMMDKQLKPMCTKRNLEHVQFKWRLSQQENVNDIYELRESLNQQEIDDESITVNWLSITRIHCVALRSSIKNPFNQAAEKIPVLNVQGFCKLDPNSFEGALSGSDENV